MQNPMTPNWPLTGDQFGHGRRNEDDARLIMGRRSHLKVGAIIERRDATIERMERKSIMSDARRIERERIERKRIEDDPGYMSPLNSLAFDIEHELLPRATEVVTRERRFARDPDATVKNYQWVTVIEECTGAIIHLERLYRDYQSERRMIESVMQHESGGGHSYSTPASTVSAMSDAMRRSTRIRDSFDARPAKDRSSERPVSGVTELVDIERNYRAEPHGIGRPLKRLLSGAKPSHRIASESFTTVKVTSASGAVSYRDAESFKPAEDDIERKTAKPVTARERRSAAHRAAAGTIRMGEQD